MKLLKTILSIGLVIFLSMEVHGTDFITGYGDVFPGAWYYDDVMRVTKYDLMQGTDDGIFDPEEPLTRAMFVTILGRLAQVDTSGYQYESAFSDVDMSRWYVPYVNWAVEQGIVYGVTEDTFCPMDHITREQIAVLIHRYVSSAGLTLTGTGEDSLQFTDRDSISRYAQEAVEALKTTGIIAGFTDGSFGPQETATRAQAAAILSRLINCGGLNDEEIDAIPTLKTILHAGGAIDGYLSTNSYEALDNAYQAGERIVELDFNFTSDGHPVCLHGWHYRFSQNITGTDPLSLEEFLDCRIYELFTPMWLGDVAEYLETHPNLYIVTDVKERNLEFAAYVSQHYPDLKNRFIIQIYSKAEYEPIAALGFPHIILTLYQMSWSEVMDFEGMIQFTQSTDLLALTFDSTLCDMDFFLERMKQTGLPLLVHTVNDQETKKIYYKKGITGIYTDYP